MCALAQVNMESHLYRVTKEVDADSQEAKIFLNKEEKEEEQQTPMSKASAASSLTAGSRYHHKHSLSLPSNIVKYSLVCPSWGPLTGCILKPSTEGFFLMKVPTRSLEFVTTTGFFILLNINLQLI